MKLTQQIKADKTPDLLINQTESHNKYSESIQKTLTAANRSKILALITATGLALSSCGEDNNNSYPDADITEDCTFLPEEAASISQFEVREISLDLDITRISIGLKYKKDFQEYLTETCNNPPYIDLQVSDENGNIVDQISYKIETSYFRETFQFKQSWKGPYTIIINFNGKNRLTIKPPTT